MLNPTHVRRRFERAADNFDDADFGYQDPGTASIGDFVWNDLNGDSIQDGGEPGIVGVTVRLIDDANGNGKLDQEERKAMRTAMKAKRDAARKAGGEGEGNGEGRRQRGEGR